MKFTLTEHTYRIADEIITCEASEMFWSLNRPIDYRGISMSEIAMFYRSKSGKIKKGERHLLFVFANEWGEPLEFRALVSMHRFMFRMGFYPEYMMEPMLEYRRLKRIEKANKLLSYGSV